MNNMAIVYTGIKNCNLIFAFVTRVSAKRLILDSLFYLLKLSLVFSLEPLNQRCAILLLELLRHKSIVSLASHRFEKYIVSLNIKSLFFIVLIISKKLI